jgi:hypothetical protein
MEVYVRALSSTSTLICALAVSVAGMSLGMKAAAQEPSAVVSNFHMQETAEQSSESPNISGSWHMSWTGRKGKQKQGTLELKQSGSKLSGTFEAPRGSAPISGTLDGDQISFSVNARGREGSFTGKVDGNRMSGTTVQGVSWTATRQ